MSGIFILLTRDVTRVARCYFEDVCVGMDLLSFVVLAAGPCSVVMLSNLGKLSASMKICICLL